MFWPAIHGFASGRDGKISMNYQQIPEHTSIRFTEDERQIIAAILKKNPHLGGKIARALSLALYTWKAQNESRISDKSS